ncbi:MAG: carbonic anhydrase [Chitinophagales bacterium]|nr:carbonic anhydrase [Chitinophagales bacterium]
MMSDEALLKLKEGNMRFQQNKFAERKTDSDFRRELVEGQNPYAAILSCADSRVAPELVFDSDLGDIFVVRVAGNIANSSSIASLEYAVSQLGTSLIVVLGHQNCGAVSAAIAGFDGGVHLNNLLAHIKPSFESTEGSTDLNDVVKLNAKKSAEALMERSEIIKEKVRQGKIKIVAAYYHIAHGNVEFF